MRFSIINTFLSLFCCFIFFQPKAQQYSFENVNTKAQKLYNKALTNIADGNMTEAIINLQKTIEADESCIDAYLSLTTIYSERKDYANAVKFYEEAKIKDSIYTKVYLLPYSINLAGLGKFKEALAALNSFLSIPNLSRQSINNANNRKKNCEFAIDYSNKHPNSKYNFEPINLGDSINSERAEYYPTLGISDSLLVFTRMTNHGEDFIKSKLVNGVFTMAETVEGSINMQALKGAATVSNDGEYLIFAGDFFGKGYGSYDLYISYQTQEGWSEPENLGPNINTPYWESAPSISSDGRTLYFSSDRPEGFGKRDLYMSTRMANGRWGPAVNLGSTINTAGNDLYPYIHADNQTLYYTSDGLPGYGNTDLFITRKNGIDGWSEPQNLGYPINTIEDEGSICISSDGTTAYYASDRSDSKGGLDLYKFYLPEDLKPFKTLYVKGIVSDASNNIGIPCNVELIDNSTNKIMMKVMADELGNYWIPLPTGKDYTFVVNRKGYLYYSDIYALSKEKSDSVYIKNITLQPISLNTVKQFKNVQFESNSYNLLPISKIELDKLFQLLIENPTIKLEIIGHTDNVGKQEDNVKLSTNRAKAVVEYLVNKGIDLTRLSFKGLGASKPIADNTTEEGRSKNRRTEFVITGI